MVGVPAEKTNRDGPITNASLAYIHDHGAPEVGIPARPFMEPGIESVQAKIEDTLYMTAKAAGDGRPDAVRSGFQRAGMIAQAGIRAKIQSNIGPPLKPETIANRARGRGTKGQRKSEKKYAGLIASGASPAQAQSQAGIIALVDTGQMRNAISYVVRKV
jgi:hypothetical protein